MKARDYHDRDPTSQPGQINSVVVGVAATQICGPSPTRRTIAFSATSTAGVNLSNNPGVTAGAGIVLSTTKGIWVLTVEEYGSLVTGAWFGIGSAPGDTVQWAEVLNGT